VSAVPPDVSLKQFKAVRDARREDGCHPDTRGRMLRCAP